MSWLRRVVLAFAVVSMASACESAPAANTSTIVLNDMRTPAGELENGVLTASIEAREGDWRANGPDGAVMRVAAFAEAGEPMQNPGPLLRAPAGTEVHVTVANTLQKPLTMYGLGSSRGVLADSVRIEPGASHEFSFTMGDPGVFYYVGRTEDVLFVPDIGARFEYDSQLNGGLVIDEAGATAPPQDRIFMITGWATFDSTRISGLGPNATLAINGAMYPYTEHFDVEMGDSLHWKWINPTILPHPLHLHGFYFRTDGRGDGKSYTSIPEAARSLAVTELMLPGSTMEVAWSPNRPGNWIFHCHFAGHMISEAAIEQDRRHPLTIAAAMAATNGTGAATGGPSAAPAPEAMHANHAMSGLVLGITVRDNGAPAAPTGEARPVRLLLRSRPEVYGAYAGYGFALGGSPEEAQENAFNVPGPLLVLERGQPVAMTLVNQSHEPGAVHWHGIELDSYADGVPGVSGSGQNILPTVEPGDSLTIRFTPPRAGTFMYHSHFNEQQQIGSGMYGAIVVLEPGQTYDPDRDRVLLFSDEGPTINVATGPFPTFMLNGQGKPGEMSFRTGVTYRLRLINITAENFVLAQLLDGEAPANWMVVAKDGAEMPAAARQMGPSVVAFAAGEIYDVEFTPQRAGMLTLQFSPPPFPGAPPPPVVDVPVRIR